MRTGFLLCLLLAGVLSASTNRTLTGKVVDGWTGKPLVGASVVIHGTWYGGATDTNGIYIVVLPETAGTATACHAGYDDTSASFAIAQHCTTRLDFRLYIVLTGDRSRAADSVLVCHLNLDTISAETAAAALSTVDAAAMLRSNRVRLGLLERHVRTGSYRAALKPLPSQVKKDAPPYRPYAELVVGDSFSFYRTGHRRIAANAGGLLQTYEVTSMAAGYFRDGPAGGQEFEEYRGTPPKGKWLVLRLGLLNGDTVIF